ncbi:predicted protein [Histoplasma capsulatum G186AR]|uniref:Uncharacterized protein n=1 Tax=Ajellomyces capsulatus (strain G186AR / H82 / ATCC MYA-2454 / RMSCC 2432) TaxID=447093 RepID=C0NKK3_AJECG|nr:uncharacterized protein HCBG_03683 [Histoplasma capsulatum G186AR]EEH08394.1 predicted protein [Histoplasma capsulatum G186AR]
MKNLIFSGRGFRHFQALSCLDFPLEGVETTYPKNPDYRCYAIARSNLRSSDALSVVLRIPANLPNMTKKMAVQRVWVWKVGNWLGWRSLSTANANEILTYCNIIWMKG